MAETVRLSFSIDTALCNKMARLMKSGNFQNRSEFIRDLVRDRLVQEEWDTDARALGTIMLLYNHEQRHLSDKLTHLQHAHHDAILATTHVHVDKHTCAEMIMVKGKASTIREITDLLRQQRGVLHASLSISSLGKHLN